MARLASLLLALALVAGCAPDEEAVSLGQPIVNGQLDSGDPAVVALGANGYLACTGTLITTTVVLTAAHCVPPYTASSFTDLVVFFGSDVYAGGTTIAVVDGWAHPAFSLDGYDHDIALLRIAQAGPTAPLPINTTGMSVADVGTPVRLIGFGMTSENNPSSAGKKRQGSTIVGEVYSSVFTMPMQPSGTCSGDSGGTALIPQNAQEVVAGVHSRSDCISTAIDTRVDAYLTEINAFTGPVTPGCGFDNQCASGCAEPDPDCPCAGDGFCSSACGDPASDPDCDPACAADGTCAMTCPMPDPDCGGCIENGVCTPGCADDPDCDAICPGDNICDPSCDEDPDCWAAGDLKPQTRGPQVVRNGCTLRTTTPRGSDWGWLLVLVLVAIRRSRAA